MATPVYSEKYPVQSTTYDEKYVGNPEAHLLKEDTAFLLLETGGKIVIGGLQYYEKYQ